jgi:hypothetical protein
MNITYIQYKNKEKWLLYEWNEPNSEVLQKVVLDHDEYFIEFLKKCDLEEIKDQINGVLNNYE